MKKPNKIKSYKEYELFKSQLSRTNETYKVVRTGQTFQIICENSTRKYSKIELRKGMKSKGYHLCNLVKKQCECYMTMFESEFSKRMVDYNNIDNVHCQCYNEKGLLNHGKNFAYSIDINDCYWKTLYLLGYIDWYLFIEGLYDDNWKTGRNSSVGSLVKKYYIYNYVGDVLINKRPDIILPTQEYITIRNHVLTHVWTVFSGLIKILGDDFLMFFTDCVYVGSRDSKRKAERHLIKAGYMVKTQNHEIESFDKSKNMVVWDCLEDRKIGLPITLKYYSFDKKKQEISNISF